MGRAQVLTGSRVVFVFCLRRDPHSKAWTASEKRTTACAWHRHLLL